MSSTRPSALTASALPRWAAAALSLSRQLAIGFAVCLVVAVFLSVVFNDPFGRVLVFSLCIGLSCQLLIDGGRRLAAGLLARRHPGSAALRDGWPGWHWMLPIVLGGSWAGIQLGYPLAGRMLGIAVRNPGLDRPRVLFTVMAVSLVAALAMIYWSWSRARIAAEEARAQAAQRAAAENQLKLLESQLEPHMLFNTLANLRVLIGLDPVRAQAMLDHLIAFLRATLQASRSTTHTLAEEFARLDDYLALMAVRMGPRLGFTFDLPDELRNHPVPPLLLQPLVENSIKHGLEPQLAGGRIDVLAERRGGRLLLSVRDSGAGMATATVSHGTHFGLAQVRDRLAATYGSGASLTLEALPDGGTLARLCLPLPPTPTS
ncbi:MAG: histidine kinase [Pseudomonadota bacterium]